MKKKPNSELSKKPKLSGPEIDETLSLFLRTGNPFLLLSDFVWAHKNNQPIPDWVVGYLAEAFEKYLNFKGKVSLDKLLGLAERGKRAPFQKMVARCRDSILADEVFMLHSLGVTMETAIEAVAEKYSGSLKISVKPKDPGSEEKEIIEEFRAVKPSYLRRKCYHFQKLNPGLINIRIEITSKWSPTRKNNFIKRFPLLNHGFKVT